jgi:hypothetical protein
MEKAESRKQKAEGRREKGEGRREKGELANGSDASCMGRMIDAFFSFDLFSFSIQ